jgi:hypothetical protein
LADIISRQAAMTLLNSGRLAIHRRSDEISFLQHRLRVLEAALQDNGPEDDLQTGALERERDLADELLHTRQTEPLGETLQRRLAMAERICRDLTSMADEKHRRLYVYRVTQLECRVLAEMLKQWWAWLDRP